MAVRSEEVVLLASLRAQRQDLVALLNEASGHWGFEDPVYRFYHGSFKVYRLQQNTDRIVRTLQAIAPERPLHASFQQIVAEGTGKTFAPEHNATWTATTRPILEAFFHARYFLEMAVRYSTVERPPTPLPSGYAALLELYALRY